MSDRKTRVCGSCGGQIGWMEQPPLIPGFTANCWEGWFHLDAHREHFGRVGWTDVNFATGSEPPHVTTESTSAALRRAEQERDELRRERDRARAERDEVERQRTIVRAELASARQELDAVRTARDNLDRELAEARATIRALTRTGGTA